MYLRHEQGKVNKKPYDGGNLSPAHLQQIRAALERFVPHQPTFTRREVLSLVYKARQHWRWQGYRAAYLRFGYRKIAAVLLLALLPTACTDITIQQTAPSPQPTVRCETSPCRVQVPPILTSQNLQ